MVQVETEEKIRIIEVAYEILQDRGLEVQASVEVESRVEEVAQVVEWDDKIITEGEVPKSPAGTSTRNASKIGGSTTHRLINNPLPSLSLKESSVYFTCNSFESFIFSATSKTSFHSLNFEESLEPINNNHHFL